MASSLLDNSDIPAVISELSGKPLAIDAASRGLCTTTARRLLNIMTMFQHNMHDVGIIGKPHAIDAAGGVGWTYVKDGLEGLLRLDVAPVVAGEDVLGVDDVLFGKHLDGDEDVVAASHALVVGVQHKTAPVLFRADQHHNCKITQ